MATKSEALRLEMAELGEQIRQVNSKDKPEAADYEALKGLTVKMKDARDRLAIVEEAEKIDAEMSAPAKHEKGQEARAESEPVPFGKFCQAIAAVAAGGIDKVMSVAEARNILQPKAATGMNESVPSEGGFLVGTQQSGMLAKRAYDEGKLGRMCQRVTISGPFNGLTYSIIDEANRGNGYRAGGVLGYWINEAGTATKSKPKIARETMNLEKLAAVCYATEELLQDATALETILMDEFGKEMGFKLDDAIINGTGAGQPLGILNAPCLVSQAKETGQTAATINFDNVVNMYSRFAGSNGVWIVNKSAFPQLMKLGLAVGTGGFPLFIPGNSLANAPNGSLLGMPIVFAEQSAALGTVGDIILADMGQYRLIEKGGIQSASSMHVQFLYDEMTYRFIYRVNGQPLWKSAVTPYKDTAKTFSPFVALATRA